MSHSIPRWPTPDEVRANYLTPGAGWAYALVRGFSDYENAVVRFYINRGMVDDDEVYVDFMYGWQQIPVGVIDQQDGFTVDFLCLANSDDQLSPNTEKP